MINFLKTISENNIYLNLIDGELKLFSENENIDPELLKEIKSRKAEIISYLEENKGFQAQAKNNNEIPVIEEADSYELSDSQKQLWIMSKMEGASVAYNIPNQVVLNGEYDINYFSKAINWVIDRHEILRTIFKENAQGEIRQWILSQEELGFSIDYCDFRNEENSEVAVGEYIREDSYKAFDLSNGPLLRASLLQVADDSYVFYYNMHHIISDGWSMEVLGRDVLACYNAFAKAETPTIPALRIQYKEYAAWQQAQIQDGKAKEQKQYWLDQLSGELPVLNLPNQKTRPVVKTYNGASLSTGISSKETKELKNFTQNNGGSLFMSLVAVWNVLIHKYTSQKDIITGTPVAGRNHLDLENQIGFYVNMLALRNEINPEENFINLFKKVKDNTLTSFENQQYPFDRLIQDLEIQKDRSRSPIFDAIVVLQNTSDNTYAIDENEDAIHNITDLGVTNSKYDLELIFQEVGDNLLFKINYNTDVYDSSTIETLINHYKNLLSSVLVNPSSNISEFEYLSAQEVALQLEEFNTTITTYPAEASIVKLFTEQALKTPDAIALSYGDRSVTYQELEELSNQVAHYLLVNHTIEVEDFIGVRLEKSDWTIVAILGVLKSGGVYVPIDPNYPSQRIAYIEKDTNCKVTIDDVFLTEFKNTSLELPTVSPEIEITADNLAYVMYTSGSTGIPKGVMVEHRNVVRLVKNSNFYNFSNTDVLLSTGSFSFDATTFEYWAPLLNGGELVMCSQETLLGVESLSNEIKNRRVSVMWFTAGWLNQLVDTDIDLFNGLSTVLVGGDRLSPSHIGKLRSQYPSLEIINGYGPTENTTFSLTYNIGEVSGDIPIGYPISNSSVYILDEHQSLVVRGGIGEIYLGGDGLSRGYLNQAELTAEKFVEDRFRESGKLYKTGDLGYWNEDGSLSFIGRKDAQVKIRGYRIELPEIEARLLQQNNVDKAVVEVLEVEGQKSIVAYISSSTLIDKKSVQESLQVELPDYMLPSYYVVLDNMPLNPNGKVDRKALPAVSEDDIIKEEYVAPRTIEERVLVEVLQQILKRDAISIKDNFYNLGGDSIKSIQVVSRLKQQGYSLKVDDILRNPVLEYLSKLLLKDTRVIDQLPVEGEVELTPIQEGFFSNSKIRVLDHFNQSVLLKSTEAIDLDVLRKSVSALVAHHDILRAVYNKSGGNWSQVNKEMTSEDHYTLDSYDLRNDEDAFATMSTLGLELQSSINIGDGPLMKVGHFQLPSGEERLAIIIHHLVIDGVSWRILLEDLSNAYLSHKQGVSVELPLKTDSFQRWASLQKEYANSDVMEAELPYWEEVNALSIDPFPVDKESNEASIHFDKRASFVLDTVMTELLQTKTNRVYNTEVNDILLTSLGLAIQDVFEIDRSVIEMEGHGREDIIEDVDVSRTVGWFTSVYPFVLDMSDSGAKREGLVQVKEDLRKIPKKGIGYGILKYLSDSFTSSVKPSIVFNYLGDFGDDVGGVEEAVFEYASEDIGTDNSPLNGETALLSISGMMVSGQLTVSIKYSDILYQSETIERLASSYQEHLSALITDLSSDNQSYITPSDVTYKELTGKELAVLNKENTLEDVYKLSPLQQGIYYHWLSDNSTSLYFEQVSYRLQASDLEISSIKQAYDALVARHSVLRTSFTSGYGNPLQVVYRNVESGFSSEQFKGDKESNAITSYVNKVKQADRDSGFDLETGSQMRLKVLELGDDSYEFIWSFHHILMDGWCMSILINDFYKLLMGIRTESKIELPLPVRYSNYISWLDSIEKSSSLAYWQTYLSGYSEVSSIPFKARDVKEGYDNREERVCVDGNLFDKVNHLCTSLGITQNTFVQGVWGYLLSKYNTTNDVVFGSVVSGRPPELQGVEDMIGLFINTVPVRVHYDNTDTVNTLFKRVQDASISGTPHHYLNLSEVQSQNGLGMDLIDHIMVFENYPIQDAIQESTETGDTSKELSVQSVDIFEQTNYDFNIDVAPTEDTIGVAFRYNANKYDPESIRRVAKHFENLVDQFSNDVSQSLQEISYIIEEEKYELLEVFNNRNNVTLGNETILNVFEEVVKNNPTSIAVISDNQKLSYKELDDLSTKLASYLHDVYSIEKGNLVGVKLERDEWLVVTILSVFKLGGVYLPIDPSYPEDRIDYLLNDSNCNHILDVADILSFKEKKDAISLNSLTKRDLSGLDLAYIIYTSGSTGNPKGTMIEHAGMLNHMYAMEEELKLNKNSIIVQNAPSTFDISIWQLLNNLIVGGTTSIYSQSLVLNPQQFLQRIESEGVTILQVVPSYLKALIEVEENIGEKYLETLSYLLVTGEAVGISLIDKWFERYPNIKVVNAYGPAEASDDVTLHIMESSPKDVNVPVGKPIRNIGIHILDDDQQLCGKGIVGEICVSGIGVGRGYLNREALTLEKFITHPLFKEERLYRTGDLGQWSSEGDLLFIGRKDDQVKVRGHRIELGEIEYQLQLKEDISDVVVIVKELKNGTKDLVAYIVAETPQNPSGLREFLSQSLPSYMLPSYYIELSNIPLSPNGKVDKKALPEVSSSDIIKEEYVAPRTTEEKVLVSVLEQILRRETISVKDNFYNLGGDSIKSIQVVSRLKQQGYSLKVDDILRNPVLEYLSKLLLKDTRSIDQSPVVGSVVLTPIQELFFTDSNIRKRNHYNQSVILSSTEPIDLNALEQSLSSLVSHHDILRVVYNENEGVWLQESCEISAKDYFTLDSYNLTDVIDPLKSLNDIGLELQSSINISEGPLFKIGHFQLPGGEERLALIIHHLVVDGVSWRILLEDLSNLYLSYIGGFAPELPLKTDSFQRWSFLQKEHASSEKMLSELPYWRELGELSLQSIPVDLDAGSASVNFDKQVSFSLDKIITNSLLTKVNSVYSTDINDFLLTSLGLALQDVFGVSRSVIEMEGHGREDIIEDVDISRTVGWFTSVYPFVLDLSKANDSRESLIQIKESLRKIPNKGIGYGILKYASKALSDTTIDPSIIFNYLGDFGEEVGGVEDSIFKYASERIGTDKDSENGENTLLSIAGMTVSGQLSISIQYSGLLHHPETIERLASKYQFYLESLVKELSSDGKTYLTPSDLIYKGLTFSELSSLNINNRLENVYELSPLQQGIYYHWLSDSSTSLYFEQVSYRLQASDIEISSIKKAYDALVARHSVLRTSFTNSYGNDPLQVVFNTVESGFSSEVFTGDKDIETITSYVNTIKQKDRDLGFDLDTGSQMRLKVLDLGEGAYEFIWSHHHILMDGWCMSILINDFYKLLINLSVGSKIELPVPAPYANYISWLNSIDKSSSLSYWQTYLEGYTEVSSIPFTTKSNQIETISNKEEQVCINGALYDKMITLCTSLGITQSTFTQGVWGYLLSKYNMTNDVVFGSVVSGRPAELPGVEDMIGLFINTIPVRVCYEDTDTVEILLKKLQETSISSTSHHYLNLSEVQSQSELGMDLIDHIMVFENYPIQDAIQESTETQETGKELSIEAIEMFEEINYDFNIDVTPSENSLTITFKYNTNLYDADGIELLAKHFQHLVEQFSDDVNQTLQKIAYITAEEKEEILQVFNNTNKLQLEDETIVDIFKKQVARVPNKVAVVFGDKKVTYQELDLLSNQLANYLSSKTEFNKNNLIGIKLEKSENVIISILGILKTGAAYVPIDVKYPDERIQYIESDSQCTIVIDDAMIQDFEENLDEYSQDKLNVEVNTTDLCYVIYTSGSTGNPKGVLVDHKSVVNIYYGWKDSYSLDEFEVNLLQLASFSFDMSVADFCRSVLNGGTMVICSDEAKLDQESLYNMIQDNNVSVFEGTPSLVVPLMNYIDAKSLNIDSLKMIILGGESVNINDFEYLATRFGNDVELINSYGVTEATIDSTFYVYNKDLNLDANANTPIGIPFPNTNVYILNDNELVSKGVVGEICIGGDSVAKGYLNRPELTNQKFINDPYKEEGKLYKTGDLGKWLPDGNIEFIGRKDDQVKIHGYRIELGEIENQLLLKEDIDEAVVLVKVSALGDKELVAYITSKKEQNATDLRKFLFNKVPHYMCPSHFVQLESLPLTVNGKVDKKALPNPNESGLSGSVEYMAPQNEIEERLTQILSKELDKPEDQIGVQDNFFDLGMNSIKLLRILNIVNKEFNITLKPALLFEFPNISELAENFFYQSREEEYEEDVNLSEEIDEFLELMD